MTLLKEFTTWPRHQCLFYKVTSNAINFRVSGTSAVVGLATKPKESCEYKITLTAGGCSIQEENGEVSQNVRNLISAQEFKEFWITWRNKEVNLGRGSTTLVRKIGKTKHLKYVTFFVNEGRQVAKWQCYLPPVIEDLPLKPISGGEPYWVSAEEQLPDDALIAGFEGEFLYAMRAEHRGALTPGKFVPSLGVGLLPWGGETHEGDNMEILCGYNVTWVRGSRGRVPAGAPAGGRSEGGEALHVARAPHAAHALPGKLQPSHRACYVPHKRRELAKTHYEVLVVPHRHDSAFSTPRCDSDAASDADSDSDSDTDEE